MPGTATPGLFRLFKKRVIRYLTYRRVKTLYNAINRQMEALESRFIKPLRHA
jgi:hypothetical protein